MPNADTACVRKNGVKANDFHPVAADHPWPAFLHSEF
jgi:hypothetical protein